MNEVKGLLKDLMADEVEAASNETLGSDEHSRIIDDICKLYRLELEQAKIESEIADKTIKRDIDIENRRIQFEERKLDRVFKVGADIVSIGLPLMFYGIWMNRGFRFEESGTYTSTTFRNLFNRFRPTEIK